MAKKREDRVQTPQDLVARINVLLDPGNAATGKRNSVIAGRSAVKTASGLRPGVGRTTRGPLSRTGQMGAVGGMESTGPLQRVTTGARAAVAAYATTGSAEPVNGDVRVDAASSAARKAVRPQSPAVLWGIIMSVIVIASLCLYFFGKSDKPAATPASTAKTVEKAPEPGAVVPPVTPPPASTVKPAVPDREDKARSAFAAVQELEKVHPEKFAEILESFKQAAEVARDMPVATQVEEARKATELRWAGEFSKALNVQQEAAKAACTHSDYAGALAALTDASIADTLHVLTWHEQLDTARNSVHDAAETAVNKILADAKLLADAGTEAGLSGALDKLKATDSIPAQLAPSLGQVAEARKYWSAELAAAQQKAEATKKEQAEKSKGVALAIRKELAPLLTQSHFTLALEQLEKKMQDPALAGAKEALAAEKSDLEAIIALRQRAVEAIRASAGKNISLNRGKSVLAGKVVNDPSGKTITVKLAEGPEMAIGIDQLEARDINTRSRRPHRWTAPQQSRGPAPPRCLLFLAADDLPRPSEFFKAAQAAGLGDALKPYFDRIELVELGEFEVHARQDWAEAEAQFQAKRWEDALRSYTHFKDTHAKTKYFAEVAGVTYRRSIRTKRTMSAASAARRLDRDDFSQERHE